MSVSEHEAREVRAAQNQSLFREVNERVKDLDERWPTGAFIGFACECAFENCAEELPMTPEEYDAMRRVPTHFAVAPAHDVPEVERVVERRDPRYWIVEKFGEGGKLAIRFDPRSRRRVNA